MRQIRLTTPEVSDSINRQYGATVPPWRLRQVIDLMEAGEKIELQRAGRYRTVSGDDVGKIVDELRRRGWMKLEAAPC